MMQLGKCLPAGLVLVVVLTTTSAYARELRDPTATISLEGLWLFRPGDNPSFARPQLDDLHWLERRVPTLDTAWSERWSGYGWYRRHLQLSKAAAAQDAMISVGPVREAAQLYVNGSLVAVRGAFGVSVKGGAWALPLSAVVPAGLLREGDNLIALRVYDPNYTGGLVAGPILFGNLDKVESQVRNQSRNILVARLGLAALALFVALGQALLMMRRGVPQEGWWLVAAGASLAVVHLAGVGLFSDFVPADFTSRIPTLAIMLAILSMGSYFSGHYGDLGTVTRGWGQAVLLVFTATLMLIPPSWQFFAGPPVVFLAAMVTTLYVARLCVQAVRRAEPGALPVFIGLAVLGVAVVFDGFVLEMSDLLPPKAAMTSVLVLALTSVTQLRQTIVEHRSSLIRVQRLSQRLEEQPYASLIDATVMPMLDPEEFLDTAIHEVARDMEVRRCSLVLNHSDGRLRIRASVGLPAHLAREVIEPKSISGYVYREGVAVTSQNLPAELQGSTRGEHNTEAFVCVPVKREARVLGVLNVADRNDGGVFSKEDEELLWVLAERLGLAISILDASALEPPAPGDPARQSVLVRRRRTSKARRLTTRRRPSPETQAEDAKAQEALAEASRVAAVAAAQAEGGRAAHPWSGDDEEEAGIALQTPSAAPVASAPHTTPAPDMAGRSATVPAVAAAAEPAVDTPVEPAVDVAIEAVVDIATEPAVATPAPAVDTTVEPAVDVAPTVATAAAVGEPQRRPRDVTAPPADATPPPKDTTPPPTDP